MSTSIHDQVEGKVHEVKGAIKEKVGQLTNDPQLEQEGAAERIGGVIQKKIGQIKEVFEK